MRKVLHYIGGEFVEAGKLQVDVAALALQPLEQGHRLRRAATPRMSTARWRQETRRTGRRPR